MPYFQREADETLRKHLEAFSATLIEGPKWCGKTTTAQQQAKSVLRLQDPDMRGEYLATAGTKPSLLLAGDTPRLIDEWQDAPVLWDAVRTMADKRTAPGQFILTGSNTVDQEAIRHSGTGRISRIRMLPMSLWESKESTGEISLRALFDDPSYDIDGKQSRMQVEDLIYAACRGGWPAALQVSSQEARLLIAKEYVRSLCESDISRVDGVSRSPKLARQILRSYARNISTMAQKRLLLSDITASGELDCSMPTLDSYLAAFEKLFVIQDVDAWCPSFRSKAALRSSPKREFCDPSIAVAALGLSPESLSMRLKTFGFIFETMCIRDLKAYTMDSDSHVSYYRDRYGLEADVVLHLEDGRYALIECKLGGGGVEEGARHLLEIKKLIHEHNAEEQVPLREPDLLIVLTGGKLAWRRDDGVCVIPLACLKD